MSAAEPKIWVVVAQNDRGNDPTNEEFDYIIRLRGGCTCFISPPCVRCCNPFTDDEASEALKETNAD